MVGMYAEPSEDWIHGKVLAWQTHRRLFSLSPSSTLLWTVLSRPREEGGIRTPEGGAEGSEQTLLRVWMKGRRECAGRVYHRQRFGWSKVAPQRETERGKICFLLVRASLRTLLEQDRSDSSVGTRSSKDTILLPLDPAVYSTIQGIHTVYWIYTVETGCIQCI